MKQGIIHRSELVWPGTETLQIIESPSSDTSGTQSDYHTTPTLAPIEVAEADSKYIETISTEQREPRINVRIRWDRDASVFRIPDTNEIIGVPAWSIWKTIVHQDQASEMYRANLKWNAFLKKY